MRCLFFFESQSQLQETVVSSLNVVSASDANLFLQYTRGNY
jgi:hypothetical protein